MENNLVVHILDSLNGRLVVDTNLGRFTWHPQDKPVQDAESGPSRKKPEGAGSLEYSMVVLRHPF